MRHLHCINILLALVLLSITVSCTRAIQIAHPKPINTNIDIEQMLIGSWSGKDDIGREATLVFHRNNKAELNTNDINSKDEEYGDYIYWSVDSSKDPIHLNLTFKFHTKSTTFPLIIKFIEKDKILLCSSNDLKTRPSEFTTVNNNQMFTLNKL